LPEEATHDKVLPLWEHITELSQRAKVWIYSFVASTLLYLLIPSDLSFLQNPFQSYHPLITTILLEIKIWLLPPGYTLIGGTVTTPLEIILVAAAVFGFGTSIPVLAYEAHKFIDPAIKPGEKQSVYPFVTAFSVLWLVGAAFAFFVLLPFVFYFSLPFFRFLGISPFIYADQFYNLIFFVIVASGFAFTIPVFFVLLVKLHVLGTKMLTKNRKYVWAVTLILTAIASPDGGPLADIALFVPIIILLEGSIWFAKRYEKGGEGGEPTSTTIQTACKYCGGDMDSSGVFCSLCGKARL
jgi:Sec-independent protein secretion pathway component TatC